MARERLSYLGWMRPNRSNRRWWQPILLAAAGLLGLFPTFSLADDQVSRRSIDLTGSAPFNRSTTKLVLAIHTSARSGLGLSTSFSLDGQENTSIVGAPGETVTLNLRNFVVADHSSLTLQGTATTTFIINVTKQFSLSGSSQIILSGGLQCDHVFFNVLGRGSIVSLNDKVQLYGTLTAMQRTININDSIVYGVVRARKILLTEGARIIPPPVISQ